MIEATNITKKYNDGNNEFIALENINLKINDGDFFIISGRSGSGKSTLLYQLSLLDMPTSGKIIFDECDVGLLSNPQRTNFRLFNIGYIFQDYALVPELNAIENVILPLLMIGDNKSTAYSKAIKIFQELGLDKKIKNFPSQLSGGEQQRVSVARALANNPRVIFADEPTANLDSENALNVIKEFKKLNQKGLTIVMVTHEKEYFVYGNKIIELLDGKIIIPDKPIDNAL